MNKLLESLIQESEPRTRALWAADCAERALEYFEIKFPEDKRPRDAIAATRAWAREDMDAAEVARAADAAHKAARHHGVNETSAAFAARAAASAAGMIEQPEYVIPMLDCATAAIREASLLDPEKAAAREREWQCEHLRTFQS
jgi:hypothetical protein